MSKRKLSDMAGCSAWAERDIIEISDDDEEMAIKAEPEEVIYRDIHEAPKPVTPVPVPIEHDDEDPEEDAPEEEFIPVEDVPEEGDADQSIWDEPELEFDPAWAEPAPALDDIQEEDIDLVDEIGDLPHPAYDFDAAMIAGLVQAVAAEAQEAAAVVQAAGEEILATHQAAETSAQIYEQEIAEVKGLLAAERRRTARLTTSVEVYRTIADNTDARMAQMHGRVAAAFDNIAVMVDRYGDHHEHVPFIRKEDVQRMITSVASRILERFQI